MDIRAIEMDIHKHPMRLGRGGAVSRRDDAVGPDGTKVHSGCSVDRPFTEGSPNCAGGWPEPANADEVVFLYLENALDGDPATHTMAAGDIPPRLGASFIGPPITAPRPCAADADDD